MIYHHDRLVPASTRINTTAFAWNIEMDWITKYIAIGNHLDAKQPQGIDAILCLKDSCCREDNMEFDVLCLPLIDGAGNDPRLIDEAIDFIDDIVQSGQKILVHCHAGRSRSVCVVARYLMMKNKITAHEALKLIEAQREIYLSRGIEEILNM